MNDEKRNKIACGCKTAAYHRLHKKFKLCLVDKLPNPEIVSYISKHNRDRIEKGNFSLDDTPDYFSYDRAWEEGGHRYEKITHDLECVPTIGRNESLEHTLRDFDPTTLMLWEGLHLPTEEAKLHYMFSTYIMEGYGYRDVAVDQVRGEMWNDIIKTLTQKDVYKLVFQPVKKSNGIKKLWNLRWGGPLTPKESADAVEESAADITSKRQDAFWRASYSEQRRMWRNSKNGILGSGKIRHLTDGQEDASQSGRQNSRPDILGTTTDENSNGESDTSSTTARNPMTLSPVTLQLTAGPSLENSALMLRDSVSDMTLNQPGSDDNNEISQETSLEEEDKSEQPVDLERPLNLATSDDVGVEHSPAPTQHPQSSGVWVPDHNPPPAQSQPERLPTLTRWDYFKQGMSRVSKSFKVTTDRHRYSYAAGGPHNVPYKKGRLEIICDSAWILTWRISGKAKTRAPGAELQQRIDEKENRKLVRATNARLRDEARHARVATRKAARMSMPIRY